MPETRPWLAKTAKFNFHEALKEHAWTHSTTVSRAFPYADGPRLSGRIDQGTYLGI